MDLHTIALPLYEAKRWIKFLGGVLFALGVAYALTIVGLVVAWLLLWLGVLLWQAGVEIGRAFPGGPSGPGGAEAEEVPLAIAIQKLRRFFVVAGIATLVYLVAMAVGAVTMLVLALLGMV